MNKRLWIAVVVVAILAVGGIIWAKNQGETTSKTDYVSNFSDQQAKAKPLEAGDIIGAMEKSSGKKLTDEDKKSIIDDHTVGKQDAPVVVVMYEDFACPHCQEFNVYADKIEDDYKDRVLFVFRDYNLGYYNSMATLSAAEAAYKAGGNDAFWKMNKLLFKDNKWTGMAVPTDERKSLFNDYAKQAGINDINKFNSYLSNYQANGIQDKIDRDKALGEKAGVTGTPTWFVNGKKIDEVNDSNVRKAIDEALREVGK